ncbi:hypothetical protein IMY05_C4825000100 [Salix suchowensis]|nr:hypothetical protein IMY05_C4825000100 [Salix suchowensis]
MLCSSNEVALPYSTQRSSRSIDPRQFEITTKFINLFLSKQYCRKTAITLFATGCRFQTVRMFLPLAVDAWQCHLSNDHLHGVPIVTLIEAIANIACTSVNLKVDLPLLTSCTLSTLKNVLPSSPSINQPKLSFVLKLIKLIRDALILTPLPDSYCISCYEDMWLIISAMVLLNSAPSRVASNLGSKAVSTSSYWACESERRSMEGFGDHEEKQDTEITPLDIIISNMVVHCISLPFLRVVLEVLSSPDFCNSPSINIQYISEHCLLQMFVAKDLTQPKCNSVSKVHIQMHHLANPTEVQGNDTSQQKVFEGLWRMCSGIYCSIKCQCRNWKQHHDYCKIFEKQSPTTSPAIIIHRTLRVVISQKEDTNKSEEWESLRKSGAVQEVLCSTDSRDGEGVLCVPPQHAPEIAIIPSNTNEHLPLNEPPGYQSTWAAMSLGGCLKFVLICMSSWPQLQQHQGWVLASLPASWTLAVLWRHNRGLGFRIRCSDPNGGTTFTLEDDGWITSLQYYQKPLGTKPSLLYLRSEDEDRISKAQDLGKLVLKKVSLPLRLIDHASNTLSLRLNTYNWWLKCRPNVLTLL